MNKRFKIGGEFEIDPISLIGYESFNLQKEYLYSSGRCALITILKYLRGESKRIIHLPYYICQSVVSACIKTDLKVKFYELTSDFEFPLEKLNRIAQGEILLTVNYFGFVDDTEIIKTIKSERPDITVISDQVQSFWTYKNASSDFSFTSLRKHFAIPEGALIHSNNFSGSFDSKINLASSSFAIPKLIGSILKNFNIPDKTYLKFLEEGEKILDNSNNCYRVNKFTYFLYENLDLTVMKNKRKRNYQLIYEIGNEIGIRFLFPYNEKIVPLNVPIILENRNRVREELKKKNIFLPVHWPIENFNSTSQMANYLANHELSLVIDQRYSIEDIKIQMHQLKALL